MAKDGGTKLYCPHCRSVEIMSVVNPRDSEANPENIWYEHFKHGAGFFESDPELWVFHRVRQCKNCSEELDYWEIDEFSLRDLRKLKAKKRIIEELFSEMSGLLSQLNASAKKLKKLQKELE